MVTGFSVCWEEWGIKEIKLCTCREGNNEILYDNAKTLTVAYPQCITPTLRARSGFSGFLLIHSVPCSHFIKTNRRLSFSLSVQNGWTFFPKKPNFHEMPIAKRILNSHIMLPGIIHSHGKYNLWTLTEISCIIIQGKYIKFKYSSWWKAWIQIIVCAITI